jgi:SAM-dependent methyltransferase
MSDAAAAIVARWRRGDFSAEIALMELCIATESIAAVRAALVEAPRLAAVLDANLPGCERICAMLQSGMDSDVPAATVAEGLAFARRLFDWSVQQDEASSVALYSLGSAEILARATDEVIELLAGWGLLEPDVRALEVGCGIGRLLLPVAARVRHVTGCDLAPRMVEAARRRCAAEPRVTVCEVSGSDLGDFASSSFELVHAVDSFPYIVQAGAALVQTMLAEVHRVLVPGGRFALLGYSYRGDDAADRAELAGYAASAGLTVEVAGERPFKLWNATAFRLRR